MSAVDPRRAHGGPDALGIPKYDFSTNSNACGPCPQALLAVQQADAARYPDASYRALRERLAAFHRVALERVVLAGSASEFIFRITASAVSRGLRQVRVPPHAYGDYRQAANAWGLPVSETGASDTAGADDGPSLSWTCDPASPLGDAHAGLADWAAGCAHGQAIGVLDLAYEPLRLEGELGLCAAALDTVWQMFSPNKALGLTGVRAAYALAPARSVAHARTLDALSPSWPLGAHGVALLQAWCDPGVQAWLADTGETLRTWKISQQSLCTRLGWKVIPSLANFFCVQADAGGHDLPAALTYLRLQGVKLRDAASFGLAGHFRLAVLPPQAQQALGAAWHSWLTDGQRPTQLAP